MKYSNHGANPDLFYKSANLKKPKKVIDFSTNTNVITKKIQLNINKLAKEYPDYTHQSVKDILSVKHNIKYEEIIVTNGINEVIYLLSNIYKDKKVALLKDDYTEYKRAFKDTNIIFFNNIYEVKDVDILVFSNPNNPSGLYEDLSLQILKLSKTMTVIVDESYIEFIEDKKHHVSSNTLYLRSLTKIYHLSGLRIGYVFGDDLLIRKLSSIQPTWSVNSVALKASEIYLNDSKFLIKTREFYKKETIFLKSRIIELGYNVLPSSVNFFLIEVENDNDIIIYLLKRGLVVRHTRSYPNLNGKYIRVSVKTKKQNLKLIRALKEYKDENISS